MKRSPCLTCALLYEDKNNPVCEECLLRIEYLMAIEYGPDCRERDFRAAVAIRLGPDEPWSQRDYYGAQI